ncbi:MAG: tRNA 4-thiouridine(8) synthase ThiI [Pseudomonadota bacterium]
MNTIKNSRTIRALGLCSGGLDSILSALVLRDQGIEVSWISFETPFFFADSATKASRITGVPLQVQDITESYLALLHYPPAGFGKNMNPCMDCHTLMFSKAGEVMRTQGFDFLFSGEVAGQRPFSQNKNSMRYVEKNSGYEGFILRPLSARLFPVTPMEKNALVDRDRLGSISGRSRKTQMAMARQYGITDYPAPAGGCLLTDPGFSRRLRDLMQVQKQYEARDLHLLRYGRHFRLDSRIRLVVGRSLEDNDNILAYYRPDLDVMIRHADLPSPTVLIPGGGSPETVERAAAICAGYTKTVPGHPARILVHTPEGVSTVTATAADPKTLGCLMI